jgi:uncharacterized MAPEG superfamily protein
MAVPYLCILAAFALIYLPRFVFVTPAMLKLGYDNAEPREQQKAVGGVARRALAAHQNGFETFAPFVAGVLMAQLSGAEVETTTQWSVAFVVSRLVYVAAYVLGWHPVRSLAWGVSVVAIVMLMVAAL